MARTFALTAPVVREGPTHRLIADAFCLELCAPGKVSKHGVTWWSVDMAAYAGRAPGIRTGHGCIAGVPDMIVVWHGRAHFIEVKASDGGVGLSLDQRSVATAILIAGASFGIACDDIEAVQLLDAWSIPRNHAMKVGGSHATSRQSQRANTSGNGARLCST